MIINPRRTARRLAGRHLLGTGHTFTPSTSPALGVLSISPTGEDHAAVRQAVSGMHCRTETAESCHSALRRLNGGGIAVIVCERELPDGSWRDILEHLGAAPDRPLLIVTSRVADEWLWAEVLNTGGFDVLAKPLDVKETRHVMETACLRQRDTWRGQHITSER